MERQKKRMPVLFGALKSLLMAPGLLYIILCAAMLIAIMIGLAINTFIEDPMTSVIGLAVPAVGLVLYELVFKKQKEEA